MKIKRISASCLKTYKKCEFAYYLNYIAGIREPGNFKMVVGNVVHYALEHYAKGDENYKERLKKSFKEYELGKLAKADGITRKEAFNKCVFLTEEVLNRQVNPIKAYEIIGAEKEFSMEIANTPAIGFIDLVSQISKNIIEIRDWKTGSWVQTYKQVEDDLQAKIYDIAVKEMYPDAEIWVTLDYIQGTPVTVMYTDEDRKDNVREIAKLVQEIKSVTRPTRRKLDWTCASLCIGERDGKKITRPKCDILWNDLKKYDFDIDKYNKAKESENEN